MIDSREFAKYILYKAGDDAGSINMTKLQKYLYICDGMLLSFGYDDIKEIPKAWDYGPVYPKVYKWYKDRVGKTVSRNEISADAIEEIESRHFDTAIEKVLETFKDWTARELSAWTHQPSSPWSNAIDRNNGELYGPLSKDDMKMYFSGVFVNA
nr:MAG TPA: Protein of unknown function (DUF4065) [Caudoviricetes sp.]